MIPDIHESRKITGLVITLVALLVVLTVGLLLVWLTGVGESIIVAISTQVSGLGVAHQASQATQDRAQAYSPNYPGPAPPNTSPVSPPPGGVHM